MIIKQVDNGYILKYEDTTRVFEDNDEDLTAIQALLYHINDLIGPSTSRYSKERIVISLEPGDKYEDLREAEIGEGLQGEVR